MRPSSRLLASVIALVVTAVAAPTAQAARPLRMGFSDDILTTAPADAAPWQGRARAIGVDTARVSSGWGGLAPARPANPTDPADPAYRWGSLDAGVRSLVASGITPIIGLTGAPAWAEGAKRPASATPGTWRPDGKAYAAFAQALARRYDGSFRDPLAPGATLPKVSAFQAWNEPNLDKYLTPQWTKRGRRFRSASPAIYRALLDGFYRGIKAGQPGATVVSAGTAPFGDPVPGGRRIMPARFTRDLLCVTRKLRKVRDCTGPRFDVLAHHPYSVRGPLAPALNADDVSVPDLGRLTRPLRRAEKLGTALPRGRRHRVWVTEISWDSNPPDPDGVPAARQALWLQQAMQVLWKQGVDTINWFQIRDQAPVPSFSETYQSGVFLRDGRPKPSATAFAFPFVVTSRTARTAKVWLRAPARGTIRLEKRVGGRWKPAGSVTASRHAVVQRSVTRSGATALRARQGQLTSLAFRLR
jgi:hypothetical protein